MYDARISAPHPENMTTEQRSALAEITAGPRGGLVGPFAPLLHSPRLMSHLQKTGEFLRFGSSLDRRLFEMCILLVARHWNQQFEWGFHHPLALEAGLGPDVVEAISRAERADHADEVVLAVWDVVDDLQKNQTVDDDHYAAAAALLDERGLVEIVATVGYYTTLAMVMNTARTPPPADSPKLERLTRTNDREPL